MPPFTKLISRINWYEFVQSLANGAGNTIGTIVIYAFVVLIIYLWYHNRRAGKEGVGQDDALSRILAFSKPGIAARDAGQVASGWV